MVTSLTYGRLYVCDWIDNAADADAQDLDTGTVGTNYFYLIDPDLYRVNTKQGGKNPNYYAGGKGYGYRDGSIQKTVYFIGYCNSRTELDYIDNYMTAHAVSPNTIKSNPDYLFVPYASGDWQTFRKYDATQLEYAKGWCKDVKVVADVREFGRYLCTVEFWVVFD